MVDLVPIDHDPFSDIANSGALPDDTETFAAPPSGNVMDSAAQYRSSWTDSPIAKVGRLIGERGLAGAMPGLTLGGNETMASFWKRWGGTISKLTGSGADQKKTVPSGLHLAPIDYDPFAPKKMSTLNRVGDMPIPPEELQPVFPSPPTRDPHDPMINVDRSLPLPPDRNSIMPDDIMVDQTAPPPPRDI